MPAPLPLIDYASVVGDVCENEVLIYKTEDGPRVGCVVGVYDEVDPPSVEVHRYGTYDDHGDVLRGSLKPAHADRLSGKFKFVVKPDKKKYYPVLDDVYAEAILARNVQLDKWIVPHAVAAQVASSQALPSNLTTRSAPPAVFWYQEDLLYRTQEAASKALQDTTVDPPDAQSHVVITVPRTSTRVPLGVAPEPLSEYELKRQRIQAENQAQLQALALLQLSQDIAEEIDVGLAGRKRGRKRRSTQESTSATDSSIMPLPATGSVEGADEDYSSPEK